jgi:hypothetical protein
MGPIGKAEWFKLEVENLPNGDEIACASPWKPPNPFKGVTTADMRKCRNLAQTGEYRLDVRFRASVHFMAVPYPHGLPAKVATGLCALPPKLPPNAAAQGSTTQELRGLCG